MKKLILLIAIYGNIAMPLQAQISLTASALSYTQDFNTLDTLNTASGNLPLGWEIAENGSSGNADNMYKGSTGTTTSGDSYSYGAAGDTDRALGSIASGTNIPSYGMRFINNTGSFIDKFYFSYTGEQWRLGTGSLHTDSLSFLYSLDADSVGDISATWVAVPNSTFFSVVTSGSSGGAMDGNLHDTLIVDSVSLTFLNGDTLTIKWQDPNITGADDGLAIDNLLMFFNISTTPPPNYKPNIVSLSPADNTANLPISANSIDVSFDRNISKGNTGNITIKNETDQTVQTIPITSSNITITATTATISGINLDWNKTYHVLFDATCFDTAGYNCYGLSDTTLWNFSTAAKPPAVFSLNENFDSVCANSHLPMNWFEYSVTGNQEWSCNSQGYNNTGAYAMNGFQNGNHQNEDWLITPELDLSAMPNAYLQFRAFKKFTGNDLEVFVSNDYAGYGDPTSANWVNLNVNFSTVDTNWNWFEANLTPQISNPIFIGFKYISTATDGAQWKIDNVMTSGSSLAIPHLGKTALSHIVVLEQATANNIQLQISVNKTSSYHLAIYDLTGRIIYEESLQLTTGKHLKNIQDHGLANGLYIISLKDENTRATTKFTIQ